jgi:sarcosine oxidase subunit alpha
VTAASTTAAGRLPFAPGEEIDRSRTVKFTFDGRPYSAYAGDTIASALTAAGVSVLSRSFKYHRPRGVLCAAGRCPNCMVDVDGVPNVRACVERVREGMVVRGQNAWPSVATDLEAVFERFSPLLPVGFYYKTFIRPRWLWPAYEAVLRRLAGLGTVDIRSATAQETRKVNLHCDVAVIGAGPAGTLAAVAAGEAGARVVLIDDQAAPGGHLRWSGAAPAGDPRVAGLTGPAAVARLQALLGATPGVQYISDATAFGVYEGNLIGASKGSDMYRVRARQVVVATGAQERPSLFRNNDRPGVMLASAALRMARLYGVRPGRRAVVVTDGDYGRQAAEELGRLGIEVAEVVDTNGSRGEAGRVIGARGVGRVSHAVVEANGRRRAVACDLILMAGRPEPEIALLAQCGVRPRYDGAAGVFVPGELVDGVWAIGHVTGEPGEGEAVASATAVGRAAAEAALGRTSKTSTAGATAVAPGRGTRSGQSAAGLGKHEAPATPRGGNGATPALAAAGGRTFVCVCEDVTTKDIRGALDEGFDSLETVKRYSTATMGPCQGKMCHSLSARVHAAMTGASPASTGLTTARPPFQPVSLGALAGPHMSPVRRTPLHDRHEQLGATWMDMGDWKRPLHYGSVDDECRAVHEAAGVIDVTTLGKLEVSGRDAGAFLDWLHPNRFSDLRVGRVRYRVMCDDAGIVLDDGTVARLGADRFFVTTGTTAFDAVDQWLAWWLAGSTRDVRAVNVTSQYAAINLAGPGARQVIARLTSLDVSSKGMPYLAAIEGAVAGAAAIILRIGFVGELGYEIHVPADYAVHVWDSLLDAGRELGIRPFGVEAQRVLRLEKQHLIPGQDTDALSNPIEAGLAWAVKEDKPDYIGRDALRLVLDGLRKPERDGRAHSALVGFEVDGPAVPAEGAVVVSDGRAIGRVTSCKWSATLGRAIGMAWLPSGVAQEGQRFTVRLGVGTAGTTTTGIVRLKSFYDPDGARLRS